MRAVYSSAIILCLVVTSSATIVVGEDQDGPLGYAVGMDQDSGMFQVLLIGGDRTSMSNVTSVKVVAVSEDPITSVSSTPNSVYYSTGTDVYVRDKRGPSWGRVENVGSSDKVDISVVDGGILFWTDGARLYRLDPSSNGSVAIFPGVLETGIKRVEGLGPCTLSYVAQGSNFVHVVDFRRGMHARYAVPEVCVRLESVGFDVETGAVIVACNSLPEGEKHVGRFVCAAALQSLIKDYEIRGFFSAPAVAVDWHRGVAGVVTASHLLGWDLKENKGHSFPGLEEWAMRDWHSDTWGV